MKRPATDGSAAFIDVSVRCPAIGDAEELRIIDFDARHVIMRAVGVQRRKRTHP